MDYEGRGIICKKKTLHLRDYLLRTQRDNYITVATLVPLAAALPVVRIPCHEDLFQRVEKVSNEGLQERMVAMMEGGARGQGASENEEEAHSERVSI
jgi:hypothetical protein